MFILFVTVLIQGNKEEKESLNGEPKQKSKNQFKSKMNLKWFAFSILLIIGFKFITVFEFKYYKF